MGKPIPRYRRAKEPVPLRLQLRDLDILRNFYALLPEGGRLAHQFLRRGLLCGRPAAEVC